MTPRATALRRGRAGDALTGEVVLDHEARWLRRRTLAALDGTRLLVDLPETTRLRDGDVLVCEDGRLIAVRSEREALMAVTGPGLARLAWHVGNRHAACQVEDDRLLLRRDHVLRGMLEGLGAWVEDVDAPFEPEGGAYGHGPVHGHSH